MKQAIFRLHFEKDVLLKIQLLSLEIDNLKYTIEYIKRQS